MVTALCGLAAVAVYVWHAQVPARRTPMQAKSPPAMHTVSATLHSTAGMANIEQQQKIVGAELTQQIDLFDQALGTMGSNSLLSLACTNASIPVKARYDMARKCFYSFASMAYYSNSLTVLKTVIGDAQDEETRNSALWMCGVACQKLGDIQQAYDYLKQLVDRCEQGMGTAVQMAALDALADVCRARGRYDESIELNLRYIKLSRTDSQRMSGQLMIICSEMERDPKRAMIELETFLNSAPDRTCGAYITGLNRYQNSRMRNEIDSLLASMPRPSSPEQEHAVVAEIADAIKLKYFAKDGKPLPFSQEQKETK